MNMKKVFCCVKIPDVLTFGRVYDVLKWIKHEFGEDPAIVCDDGKVHVMWKGFFHD